MKDKIQNNIARIIGVIFAMNNIDARPRIKKDENGHENVWQSKLQFELEIRRMLTESNFFANAPFKWLDMSYECCIETGTMRLHGINKTYLDLSATVELQYDEVEYYSWNDVPKLTQLLEAAMLDMIIFVGKKYKLPTELFEKRFTEIGGYPELPDDYQDRLPPSANRPTKEQVEGWMHARAEARKTSRIKRGRDPRWKIALKPIPKYAAFEKTRYKP